MKEAWARHKAVVGACLLLCLLSLLPFARALVWPPSGRAFIGVFYAAPDVYNYFSYAQQATDGRFFFENKLLLAPHPAALVNLEWWLVGQMASALGLEIPVAFRLLGLVATLALVLGVDGWLRDAGLPSTHREGALLIVFLGGGLGGLLFLLLGPPAWRFLDLTTGLFPVISDFVNPHFVIGTALLVWAVRGLNRGGKGTIAGLVLGNVLALTRPYDAVVLVEVRGLTVLLEGDLPTAPKRLLPLLGLLPGLAADYWIFYVNPAFATFTSTHAPGFLSRLLAVGPAAALALFGVRAALFGPPGARAGSRALFAWAVTGLLGVLVFPTYVPFAFQAGVNVGAPLFGLFALGMAKRPPRQLLLASLLCASTGLVALKVLLEDNPSWFVPRQRLEIARALRPSCRPGDVVVAPPDIGMYANALSSCRAFLTHAIAPDTAERRAVLETFYLNADASTRIGILDRWCVTHVILPPQEAFGLPAGFQVVARAGRGAATLEAFARHRPAGCRAPRSDP